MAGGAISFGANGICDRLFDLAGVADSAPVKPDTNPNRHFGTTKEISGRIRKLASVRLQTRCRTDAAERRKKITSDPATIKRIIPLTTTSTKKPSQPNEWSENKPPALKLKKISADKYVLMAIFLPF